MNWLFICAYAQSRSKYFAEEMQKRGYQARYCGHQPEADIPITFDLLIWADRIVVLDLYLYDESPRIKGDKRVIDFHIDDRPERFREHFLMFYTRYIQQTKKS